MEESPVRTILFDSLVLNDDSELVVENTDDDNVVTVKVIEHDPQHGPRVQTAEIAPITIQYYEDVQAVVQRHLERTLDEETFIDDDVLPSDLVENEYSRISQRALLAWSRFVDTFLTATEALSSHIVNRAQLSLSGKGMLVINKVKILAVLEDQVAIWDDFTERFEEFRSSLSTARDECQEEVADGLASIGSAQSQGVHGEQVRTVVRELTHILTLQDSKLKNTMEYRQRLSDFYMRTCSIFGKSVAAHVQKLQKTLRSLKVTMGPLLKEITALRNRKRTFCRKEVQLLLQVQKAAATHLVPGAPSWFKSWHETFVAQPPPSDDNIDGVTEAVNFLAAQISFWIQELLQKQADGDAATKKKRGRRTQVPAPPVHLTKFHKIIYSVQAFLEAGNHSLADFSIGADQSNGGRKASENTSPVKEAVKNLKALFADIEKQRDEEHKQLQRDIVRFQPSGASDADVLETLQNILGLLNAKLGLYNVMEYAVTQSTCSIRSNITTFLHSECVTTNTAIRTMKVHLKAKVMNHTREMRSKIREDTELQRKISMHFANIDDLLKSIEERDPDYCETVADTRASMKRLFAIKSVYQDLSFVDHVKERAQGEYEALLKKFKTL